MIAFISITSVMSSRFGLFFYFRNYFPWKYCWKSCYFQCCKSIVKYIETVQKTWAFAALSCFPISRHVLWHRTAVTHQWHKCEKSVINCENGLELIAFCSSTICKHGYAQFSISQSSSYISYTWAGFVFWIKISQWLPEVWSPGHQMQHFLLDYTVLSMRPCSCLQLLHVCLTLCFAFIFRK